MEKKADEQPVSETAGLFLHLLYFMKLEIDLQDTSPPYPSPFSPHYFMVATSKPYDFIG
jgi:hypothetical protein